MTAQVRASRLSADLENLKAEIAADVAAQLKTHITELLAEQAAIQNDRSVSGFCRRYSFSRFLFYDRPDEMPDVMHVGNRTIISPEAEATWIKAREAAAKTAPKRVIAANRQRSQHEAEAAEKQTPAQNIA
jgi:hypothetical protein